MKLILLTLALLATPAAFAAKCTGQYVVEDNDAIYVNRPMLFGKKGNGEMALLPFAANGRSVNFGANLCAFCGWGRSGEAKLMNNSWMKEGDVAAILDSDGKLVQIGNDKEKMLLESLACHAQ